MPAHHHIIETTKILCATTHTSCIYIIFSDFRLSSAAKKIAYSEFLWCFNFAAKSRSDCWYSYNLNRVFSDCYTTRRSWILARSIEALPLALFGKLYVCFKLLLSFL